MQVVDEEIAEIFTVEDFKQKCCHGGFEKEGLVFPARIEPQVTDADETVFTEDSSIQIIDLGDIPQWATHIAWYNK